MTAARKAIDICDAVASGTLPRDPQRWRVEPMTAGEEPPEPPEPPGGWPDVWPFAAPQTEAFPAEVFPAWLRDMVQEVAREQQVPVELPALVALSTLAASALGKVRVRVHSGWQEWATLYTCLVADSGGGKSSVLDRFKGPLLRHQIAEEKRQESANRRIMASKRALEASLKRADNAAGEAKNDADRENAIQRVVQIEEQLDALKTRSCPSYFTEDVTPEAMAEKLKDHAERLGIITAEGSAFLRNLAGQYAKAPNLSLFVKCYDGERYERDRRDGSSFALEAPLLAVGLAVQSSVVRRLAHEDDFAGEGALARFLFAYPKTLDGCRNLREPPVAPQTLEAYEEAMTVLLDGLSASHEGMTLGVTAEAQECLTVWREELEPRLGPEGDLRALHGWPRRIHAQVVRIAGLIHLAEHMDGRLPIDAEAMNRALVVGNWAIEHARAAMDLLSPSQTTADCMRACAWLARRGDPARPFSRRDLQRALHLESADLIDPIVRALERRGAIYQLPGDFAVPLRGRPAGDRFVAHPDIGQFCH